VGYIKKYADIGTRTNTVCFRRLLLARVQLCGLHKEICRYWESNQHSLFPKATASTRQLPRLHKKYADIGTRTNTVCFLKLLLPRAQLCGLHKEICRYWDSNQHSLSPKATASMGSTVWVTERNMPISGLEPTQCVSECYC
jgi:hypothetical protein